MAVTSTKGNIPTARSDVLIFQLGSLGFDKLQWGRSGDHCRKDAHLDGVLLTLITSGSNQRYSCAWHSPSRSIVATLPMLHLKGAIL